MHESEVKILEIDPPKVIEALSRIGAEKVFDGAVETFFFDFGDGKIGKRKDVLRLRWQADKVELTYKENKSGQSVKVADEHTITVSNLQETMWILQEVGVSVTKKMNKHRISYRIGDVRFDIDCYVDEFSFIPPFMEIEASLGNIEKYAKQLGIQKRDFLTWSTDELVAHYTKKR